MFRDFYVVPSRGREDAAPETLATFPDDEYEKRADSRSDRRPPSRDPEKQRGEEKRRLRDRFPVDRRAFPPEPTPWLFRGRVLFPVEVKYASNTPIDASNSHLQM